MLQFTREQKIHYTLRTAIAMCFIGHGAFGIITKPIWLNYFAVFGIGHDMGNRLMPILGSFDIFCGLIMLVYPIRAIPLWLVVWGIITASLRPLSGEPFAELIERAGNYGAPLALLIMSGGINKNFFTPIKPDTQPDEKTYARLIMCLRVVVFLLLAGHGWLNVIEKKGLIGQYKTLGFSDPLIIAKAVGIFEIISAFAILIKPFRQMIFVLIIWKIASEFFYPHHELFEWVERGGSYGSLIALWFALDTKIIIHKKCFLQTKISGSIKNIQIKILWFKQ